ncbi:hypothetical protein BaRGS_00015223 [Batillaria attramentaria]|uniref:Uncharacterized protein n=1 Tax=Batillaria attramentaria TaxID=370345 RepID=A0ABD0L382_9CAEN
MLTQAAKFQRLTDHPMHSQMSKPTKGNSKDQALYIKAGCQRGEAQNYLTTCQNPSRLVLLLRPGKT